MKIYNTLTRTKEEFIPREVGKVALYTCGPTVYNHIHIGNARTFISFDTVRRYLTWRGYDVTFVQNVTDVDDKIIAKANEEGRAAAEVATEYTQAFIDAMHSVGVLDPTIRPKATETIDDMIDLIARLIDGEHAYAVDGDVYFSVRSFPSYGKLSGRDVDDMRSGSRIEVDTRKRDPLDFALWKAAKPGEPYWESPWGQGRPGWHIECSAMSERQLGLPFDIHGGGVDLVFPHHENEIAQSEAACGVPFANYWMHGGMLQINSEKMSKSLGNFMLLKDILETYPAPVVRLFMLQTHYRSPLDFSDARLDESVAAFKRIETFVRNVEWACASGTTRQCLSTSDLASTNSLAGDCAPVGDACLPSYPSPRGTEVGFTGDATTDAQKEFAAAITATREKFTADMDDDFNTAGALGAIFELVKVGNGYLAAHETSLNAGDKELMTTAANEITELLAAVGVELSSEANAEPDSGDEGNTQVEAERLLTARNQARADKDWGAADALRDQIAELGYVIEDTAAGTRLIKKD